MPNFPSRKAKFRGGKYIIDTIRKYSLHAKSGYCYKKRSAVTFLQSFDSTCNTLIINKLHRIVTTLSSY